MDTDTFIVHLKTEDIYKSIAEEVETRLDTRLETRFWMKDELGGQIMKEFVRLRAKTDSYLKNNNDEDKKPKPKKVCQKKKT